MANTQVAKLLFEHCVRHGGPTLTLLRTGAFPPGWVETYLQLAEQAESEYTAVAEWPRELITAAYVASVYCEKRYRDWRAAGGDENLETEASLRRIRWAGDSMVMCWCYNSVFIDAGLAFEPRGRPAPQAGGAG
jgi:hypothetical protein